MNNSRMQIMFQKVSKRYLSPENIFYYAATVRS